MCMIKLLRSSSAYQTCLQTFQTRFCVQMKHCKKSMQATAPLLVVQFICLALCTGMHPCLTHPSDRHILGQHEERYCWSHSSLSTRSRCYRLKQQAVFDLLLSHNLPQFFWHVLPYHAVTYLLLTHSQSLACYQCTLPPDYLHHSLQCQA